MVRSGKRIDSGFFSVRWQPRLDASAKIRGNSQPLRICQTAFQTACKPAEAFSRRCGILNVGLIKK